MVNEPDRKSAVRRLVYEWFDRLTYHAPVEELIGYLSGNEANLYMRFPEQKVHNTDDFRRWYTNTVNRYFDQAHIVKSLDIRIDGEQADLEIQVEWSARSWDPPSPSSTRVRMDAFQRWTARLNLQTGTWMIESYIVEDIFPVAAVGPA